MKHCHWCSLAFGFHVGLMFWGRGIKLVKIKELTCGLLKAKWGCYRRSLGI